MKDEMQIKGYLDGKILLVNKYIKEHPENKTRINQLIGNIEALDYVLGTDSRSKINMAFATMD